MVHYIRDDVSMSDCGVGRGMKVPTSEQGFFGRQDRCWLLTFCLAWSGTATALFGPIQILLPNQLEHLAPGNKEGALAWVLSVGALISMFVNPIAGAFSDRTVSRSGPRLPWITGGTLLGLAGLVALGLARDVVQVAVLWCAVQAALNASWSALSALVPDRVPDRKRGAVAGYIGLSQVVGIAFAALLATIFPGVFGYFACAAFLAILVTPLLLADRRLKLGYGPARRGSDLRSFVAGFWIDPRRFPDFSWAWLARLLINLSNALALTYTLYFLRDELHVVNAEKGVLLLGSVNLAAVVLSVVLAGYASDKLGRRKVFVVASSLVMAAASAMIAIRPTWPVVVACAFALGIGFGIYTSVDFALITQVLPASDSRGQSMGTLNIASSLPQVLAPAIAAPIVTAGSGYPMLYGLSSIVAVSGAILVAQIASVR
ncbi:MFS transporter [Solwaraspora sp. WMMD406]|uniref:MFS transporter n=1 Tax=Solwaraspora sp. WMMD406 TaxID=3016095 RepID=UPI002416BAE3|nr:MFS transporter [Solwaraspora sp. WMMD406]MDG4768037.1 MFS transporter [Solwaraspora sp. WMMD406]